VSWRSRANLANELERMRAQFRGRSSTATTRTSFPSRKGPATTPTGGPPPSRARPRSHCPTTGRSSTPSAASTTYPTLSKRSPSNSTRPTPTPCGVSGLLMPELKAGSSVWAGCDKPPYEVSETGMGRVRDPDQDLLRPRGQREAVDLPAPPKAPPVAAHRPCRAQQHDAGKQRGGRRGEQEDTEMQEAPKPSEARSGRRRASRRPMGPTAVCGRPTSSTSEQSSNWRSKLRASASAIPRPKSSYTLSTFRIFQHTTASLDRATASALRRRSKVLSFEQCESRKVMLQMLRDVPSLLACPDSWAVHMAICERFLRHIADPTLEGHKRTTSLLYLCSTR
jgi:hypothetical protein